MLLLYRPPVVIERLDSIYWVPLGASLFPIRLEGVIGLVAYNAKDTISRAGADRDHAACAPCPHNDVDLRAISRLPSIPLGPRLDPRQRLCYSSRS